MKLTTLAALLSVSIVAGVHAQDADPVRLFPRELDVLQPGSEPSGARRVGGVTRLPLPAAVLAETRPDLSDVRLFDGDMEVPYLVDSGARPAPAWPALPHQRVTPVDATRRADRTGIVETFALTPPPAPPPRAHWVLALETPAPEFVRSLRVVVGSGLPVVDTSVFRFESPRRERLVVSLPPLAPGGLVSVTLAGEQDGLFAPPPLAPVFTYLAMPGAVDAPRVALPLTELARRRVDGQTWVTLACPAGLHPDALRIATTTRSFARAVSVRAGGVDVGGATIYRVDLPSLRDGAVLEVGLGRFTGDRLEVAIDDGDSPPLAELRFVAEAVQPTLVFDAASSQLVLRFGGGRVRAPRYDLAALSGAEGERLLDAPDLVDATAGLPRDNPRFDSSPALAFLGRPGVAVDAATMTEVAPVTITDAREGVVTLRVPLAIAAAARADLGDLRVVAPDGRQFPYVSDAATSADVPLRVAAPVREGDDTRYLLTLPVKRAVLDSLRVDVDARFTGRPYLVHARGDDDRERIVADGTLRRVPGETGPLVIALGGERLHDLALVIQDGADSPLQIRSVTAVARTPTLIVAAPSGDYRLFAGDDSLAAPVYEMSRGRPLIDAVPLAAATVGHARRNPAFRSPGFFERAGAGALSLWLVLLLAVLVLGAVTLRVARVNDEAAPAPPPTPPSPSPPAVAPPDPPASIPE